MIPITTGNPLIGCHYFNPLAKTLGKILLISCRPEVDTSKLEATVQKVSVIVDESWHYHPSRQFQQQRFFAAPLQDVRFPPNSRNAISLDGYRVYQRASRRASPETGLSQDQVSLALRKHGRMKEAEPNKC